MRHLAMTGIVTASWISWILSGSDMRATPPSRRMSAGTRSSAMTAQAPASSAIFACAASVTSMITPPLSISASPLLTRIVPNSATDPPRRTLPALAYWVDCIGGQPPYLSTIVLLVRRPGTRHLAEGIRVAHHQQALAHVDHARVAELAQRLRQRLAARADHRRQLRVGVAAVDADALGRGLAVAAHQAAQRGRQPLGHGAEREALELRLGLTQPPGVVAHEVDREARRRGDRLLQARLVEPGEQRVVQHLGGVRAALAERADDVAERVALAQHRDGQLAALAGRTEQAQAPTQHQPDAAGVVTGVDALAAGVLLEAEQALQRASLIAGQAGEQRVGGKGGTAGRDGGHVSLVRSACRGG